MAGNTGGAGGIGVSGNSVVSLAESSVNENTGRYYSGGIYASASEISFVESSVTENTGRQASGGIDASASDIVVDGLEVDGNTSTGNPGAGIYLVQGTLSGTRLSVRDNQMEDGLGAGIYTMSSTLDLTGVQITGNSNQDGSVGMVIASSSARLSQVVIAENVADAGSGGALSVGDSDLDLDHALLAGNLLYSAGNGGGGAIDAGPGSSVTLSYVILAGNTVIGGQPTGGGLMVMGGDVTLSHSAVVGNVLICSTCDGGAIGLWEAGTVEVRDSIVSDTPVGYGIAVRSGASPTLSTTDTEGGFFGMADPTGTDGNIDVDPNFMDLSALSALDWDFHVATDSPVIGVGSDLNPDGSPGTLGPFGGPDAGSWDLDRDGYPAWWHPGAYDSTTDPASGWDCDDQDAAVYPGAGC